jgi:hypothetical protein
LGFPKLDVLDEPMPHIQQDDGEHLLVECAELGEEEVIWASFEGSGDQASVGVSRTDRCSFV